MSTAEKDTAQHAGDAVPATRSGWWGRQARGQRRFLVVTTASVLVAVGGLIGANWVKSPAQVALERQPPQPSLITAPVVEQTVAQTILTRGIVQPQARIDVGAPAAPEDADALVTARTVAAGDQVTAGQVIAEVAGRPVIVLEGGGVLYRDIEPSDTGDDVRALQRGLARLGYGVGADGVFGPSTQAAVTAMYRDRGYEPATTGAAARDRLDGAAGGVREAQRRVQDLTDRLADAEQAQADTAERQTGPSQSSDPTAGGDAAVPPADVEDLRRDLARARDDLQRAQANQNQLAARTGVTVPRREVVLVDAFPVSVVETSGGAGRPAPEVVATLASGRLKVVSRVRPADGRQIEVGDVATITDEASGLQVEVTVDDVGALVTPQAQDTGGAGGGADDPYIPVTLTARELIPQPLAGRNVLVTVTAASSGGQVLAVPQTAITTRADGQTYVTRIDGNDDVPVTTAVAVDVGVSGSGMVEVEPRDGTLTPGQRVVVERADERS